MTPSSSSFINSSSSSSSSNTLMKSTLTPSSLFPNSAPINEIYSDAAFLDSPMPPSSSNILASQATGSAFPTQTFNWRGNSTNYQQEFKEDDKSYSDFSFQRSTRPSSLQTSSVLRSSIGFMASEEEAFKAHQQSWSYQQPTLLNSNEISTLQASIQAEYNSNYSNTSAESLIEPTRSLDDGYNWRKYGQKQVKGSENPRSYYKCTFPNCPTKKKVERSTHGHITEIIYKGTHDHPKPLHTRRNSSSFQGIQGSIHHEGKDHSFNIGQFDPPMDLIITENSSSSYGDGDIDMNSQRMRVGGDDYDEDGTDAKKWKIEGEDEGTSNSSNRAIREPKVVVQTMSDIDILDDGYRWRKYGQKVVKGNPNPRSYYKCTISGCPVRKHVERASTDLRAVITTYEGKHNHHVPPPRGSRGLMNMPLVDKNINNINNNNDNDNNNDNNNNNNDNNNSYNMSNYTMAIRSPVIESCPGQMASDSVFSIRPNGLDSIGFSRYENSMNFLFANQLQQQNQLHHLQKQEQSMLSRGKEEPSDDLFIETLLR